MFKFLCAYLYVQQKTGVGDAVIRRNSLTTLHPLPNTGSSPQFERQKTVPHGFNVSTVPMVSMY